MDNAPSNNARDLNDQIKKAVGAMTGEERAAFRKVYKNRKKFAKPHAYRPTPLAAVGLNDKASTVPAHAEVS